MKTQQINTGCSSYYNYQWTDVFSPKDIGRNKWFEYYCEHFSTYELNGTFYKFPTAKSLRTWYNKAPDGFVFALKVPKHITHIKRLAECERELAEFYAACREGLAEKLGPVLFQLPPSFGYSEENLKLVLLAVQAGFDNVVEFRNESWWRPDVYKALGEKNITFCSVNYPKLPTDVITTNELAYVRFHGNPKLFYSQYTNEELEHTYKQLMAATAKKAYVFFNNTASTAAIVNALHFKSLSTQDL